MLFRSRGRREEFLRFDWPDEVPDPQSEETFRRSRLDWSLREREPHAATLRLHRDLLRLRADEPALRPGGVEVAVMYGEQNGDEGWILVELARSGEADLVAAFNLTPNAREVPLPPRLDEAQWELRFATDDVRYGGTGSPVTFAAGRLVLPAWSAALFGRIGRARDLVT